MNMNRDPNNTINEVNEVWDEIDNERLNMSHKEYRFNKVNEILEKHKSNKNDVLYDIENKYGEIFNIYEAVYHIVVDLAQKIDKESFEIKKTYIYDTIIHIHARACQVALEILCLLRNGFADAAFARCRTLWELVIYSNFINTYGEGIAQSILGASKTG